MAGWLQQARPSRATSRQLRVFRTRIGQAGQGWAASGLQKSDRRRRVIGISCRSAFRTLQGIRSLSQGDRQQRPPRAPRPGGDPRLQPIAEDEEGGRGRRAARRRKRRADGDVDMADAEDDVRLPEQ